MDYFIGFIIILMLLDIEHKINVASKETKRASKENNSKYYKNLLGKTVSLNIENEDINNVYKFTPIKNTKGVIREIDDEWLLFEYENKKEIIKQYFRLVDVTSINEIDNE